MANTKPKIDNVSVVRRTKIETTYEYVPLLGDVLGFWRRKVVNRIGEDVEVHLNHSLNEYDHLFINGVEIPHINSDESIKEITKGNYEPTL